MPLIIEKPIGKTPLDLIQTLPNQKAKYSFAGRLDPMARGKMIILQDEECKLQDLYCHLDKIYEFTLLLGCETDTFDVLGLLTQKLNPLSHYFTSNTINQMINHNLSKYIGKINQPYPYYSSFIVNKKPLWWWSRENKLAEITIPNKQVEIYQLEKLDDSYSITARELYSQVFQKIYSLAETRHTNFRVPDIISKWGEQLEPIPEQHFYLQSFRATVSSGTYIRSLCHRIGQDLGCGGIAFDIHRTHFLESKKNIR